jgi:hypothetical protein
MRKRGRAGDDPHRDAIEQTDDEPSGFHGAVAG